MFDVCKLIEFFFQYVIIVCNFLLDYINKNMNWLECSEMYYLYCLGGYCFLIIVFIFKVWGFYNLVDIIGGWCVIEVSEVLVMDYVCLSILL